MFEWVPNSTNALIVRQPMVRETENPIEYAAIRNHDSSLSAPFPVFLVYGLCRLLTTIFTPRLVFFDRPRL